MNDLVNYQTQLPAATTTQTDNARAMQEVQAMVVMAKKFPRDIMNAHQRVMQSCSRQRLAESAMYAFPRGGQVVKGPSIRLAETLAQNWGNLVYGIRELEQMDGESVVESYAWDLETNVRQSKVFTVKHERKARGKIDKLTDPRDIYELVANNGARRLRACILGIIPQDIVEDAIEACDKALKGGKEPIIDRAKKMLNAFADHGVTQEMIEQRIGHKLDAIIEQELLDLRTIYTSLKDGMSKREDWFKFAGAHIEQSTKDLNEKFAKTKPVVKNSLVFDEDLTEKAINAFGSGD